MKPPQGGVFLGEREDLHLSLVAQLVSTGLANLLQATVGEQASRPRV